MSKNDPIVEIIDPETEATLAKVTSRKKYNPVYVAVAAATAVAAVAGAVYIYGQVKHPELMDEVKEAALVVAGQI